MSNIELPTSLLVFFYILILLFCAIVVVVTIIVAPDLFKHFSQKEEGLGKVYQCKQYLDEGDINLYEECIRDEAR